MAELVKDGFTNCPGSGKAPIGETGWQGRCGVCGFKVTLTRAGNLRTHQVEDVGDGDLLTISSRRFPNRGR